MNILLTGASGFLGGYVKCALEQAGYTVYPYHYKTNLIDARIYLADIIVNCAGETEDPLNMMEANVTFPLELLNCARLLKKRMIHVGSIIEDLPGDSLYQVTKRAATNLCLSYAQEFGTDVCVVKPATMYGIGDKEKAFLPTLWRAYCEDRPFRPTNEFRGWVHAEDVAAVIEKLVTNSRYSHCDIGGNVYHVCTDYTHNLALFDLFEKAVGTKLKLDDSALRDEGQGWPRHSRDETWEIGWIPKWNIERGVKDFVNNQMYKDRNWTGAEL